MKIAVSLLAISFFGLSSCRLPEKNEEKPVLQTYYHSDIGWTITIPEGFAMLSKSRIAANEAKGRAAVGAAASSAATADGLQHLVNFQKNQFNLLNATLEKFAGSAQAYHKNQKLVQKMVFDAYAQQKIKIDTLSGQAIFAAKPFHAFYVKIYGPNGAVVMDQAIFSALVNGHDLNIGINYNNKVDSALLFGALQYSSFGKK